MHAALFDPLLGSSMQPALDRCFAGDTVEAILDALVAEAASDSAHSGWAAETPRRLRAHPNRSDICKWQKRSRWEVTPTLRY